MSPFRILVVDDDVLVVNALSRLLKIEGVEMESATSGEAAMATISAGRFDLLLLDINLPGMDGIEVLGEARRKDPALLVVMMTAYAAVETAIAALRLGASDYIIKPFEPAQMLRVIQRFIERRQLLDANREFARVARVGHDFSDILTQNPAFRAILESARRVAETDISILLMGESGTGKEMVARAIHNSSSRAHRPLIAVNCGAIPPSLIEAELFGHVRGAYTGAVSDAKGYFERADGSTLFLDEIGELPPDLQVKLLRALQEGEVQRVGDPRPVRLDFRLITATNQDLKDRVQTGAFRRDLYYRLSVVPLVLPPLRERPEDIPLLVDHFLRHVSKSGRTLSPEALQALVRYHWPGNVRELQNVIERASILAPGPELSAADLALEPPGRCGDYLVEIPAGIMPYKQAMQEVEDRAAKILFDRALRCCGDNVTRAADLLGVSRRLLTYRLKELGLRGDNDGEPE